MGSGSSSSYNDITTGSQPYAPTYSVTKDMLKIDKKDSDIYNPNTGYFHNPTAQNLENSIRDGNIYSDGEKADSSFPYVLDTDGNIIFGKRSKTRIIQLNEVLTLHLLAVKILRFSVQVY